MDPTGMSGPPRLQRPARASEPGRPPVLTAGLMVVAIGAPILFAATCFFLMLMVWRRMDRRQWGDVPEVVPKQVIVPMPRCVKIPVVILEPDSTYGVAFPYAPRGDAASSYAGQGFSVVTVMDSCGPLWRAQSMTASEAPCTPRISAMSGGAVVPGSGPGISHSFLPAAAGSPELATYSAGTPIEFALPSLPPEGFMYSPTSPAAGSPVGAAAAAPVGKRHSRPASWDGGKPRKREPRQRASLPPQQAAPQQQPQQAEEDLQRAESGVPASDAAPDASARRQQPGAEPPEGRPARTRSTGSGFFSWLG